MWKVVDSQFNRQWYKDLIGQTFEKPPAYCQVVEEGEKAKDNNHLDLTDEEVRATHEALLFLWHNQPDHPAGDVLDGVVTNAVQPPNGKTRKSLLIKTGDRSGVLQPTGGQK